MKLETTKTCGTHRGLIFFIPVITPHLGFPLEFIMLSKMAKEVHFWMQNTISWKEKQILWLSVAYRKRLKKKAFLTQEDQNMTHPPKQTSKTFKRMWVKTPTVMNIQFKPLNKTTLGRPISCTLRTWARKSCSSSTGGQELCRWASRRFTSATQTVCRKCVSFVCVAGKQRC